MESGVTYVHEEFARTLVIGERINEILDIHRSGHTSVTTVLEYSARRGRGRITQALVAEGVTVTQEAIAAAAKLGGPGLHLLLAGLQGASLQMARHDALYSLLRYGHFPRALELLEEGVRPSGECYNALEVGAKTAGDEDWARRCHALLDVMLPVTAVEQFTDEALGVILSAGRPIHIERTLEILKQPAAYLFSHAMRYRAWEAIATLRRVGLRMTEESFRQVATDLCGRGIAARMDIGPLLDMFVQDSGQTMTAPVAEPLLLALLQDQEYALRRINGPNTASYQRARDVLLPIMRCMDVKEHLKLFDTIDRWATSYAVTHLVPVTVTAVLKHTVRAASRVAAEQLAKQTPSP
jgi:hypothetical protein